MADMASIATEILRRIRDRGETPIQTSQENCRVDVTKRLVEAGVKERHTTASKELVEPRQRWEGISRFFCGESFYLWGGAGTGKTFLAVAMMREAMERDPYPNGAYIKKDDGSYAIVAPLRFRFATMVDLLMEIRDSFGKSHDTDEQSIVGYFSEHPCLVLDDIGVERVTEWTLETLYAIIDRRYGDMRQTVFTSNLDLSDLVGRLGERIPSRIAEMCAGNIIKVGGADRRIRRTN